MKITELQYKIDPVRKISELECEWVKLANMAESGVFLSWEWVSNWAHFVQNQLFLCTVRASGQLVSMGFFTLVDVSRHSVMQVKQLRLHSTGVPETDQVWPEYNGMLIYPGYEASVYGGLVAFLETTSFKWDELVVGPVTSEVFSMLKPFKLHTVELWQAPAYKVDFSNISKLQAGYLESLSKNTRQQIRRSMNHYRKEGELIVRCATTKADAIGFFNSLGVIHKQRWGQESGFQNHFFTRFHLLMIERCYDSGTVELLKLEANGKVLGYLYNFIFSNTAYFYMSGICPSIKNKLKPGLVFHSLCIDRYIENGLDGYDFLGGDSQYKRSLSNHREILEINSLQKPMLKFFIERGARQLKASVKHIFELIKAAYRNE